jgi:hypothetical protein
VGPYQLSARIGAGGMGEVYKALVMVKTESTAARLIVISNWLSELTRLVPAR